MKSLRLEDYALVGRRVNCVLFDILAPVIHFAKEEKAYKGRSFPSAPPGLMLRQGWTKTFLGDFQTFAHYYKLN